MSEHVEAEEVEVEAGVYQEMEEGAEAGAEAAAAAVTIVGQKVKGKIAKHVGAEEVEAGNCQKQKAGAKVGEAAVTAVGKGDKIDVKKHVEERELEAESLKGFKSVPKKITKQQVIAA